MSENELSVRGRRIVAALKEVADDLEAGVPIESKYTVRQVRVVPSPQPYTSEEVRAVRDLIGASQEVFAQILAVSPATIRSWEQGARKPSAMARRFLDEIRMSPGHFRGRITEAARAGIATGDRQADESRCERGGGDRFLEEKADFVEAMTGRAGACGVGSYHGPRISPRARPASGRVLRPPGPGRRRWRRSGSGR
jgi:putative transcriptional regulator